MARSKYDTLIHLIEKEDGWAMFEDEKTFPDGVVIVARYDSFFRFTYHRCNLCVEHLAPCGCTDVIFCSCN